MTDPLSVPCPACGATVPYPCMDCKLTPQASTICWEVAPHQERIDAANKHD